MADDRLAALTAAGVSIWLDDLSRGRLVSGDLRRLIDDKHVVGVTTNPTIFAAALAHPGVYTPQIRELARRGATAGDTLTGRASEAREVIDAVAATGVDLAEVFMVLERDGVDRFTRSWADLHETVRRSMGAAAE